MNLDGLRSCFHSEKSNLEFLDSELELSDSELEFWTKNDSNLISGDTSLFFGLNSYFWTLNFMTPNQSLTKLKFDSKSVSRFGVPKLRFGVGRIQFKAQFGVKLRFRVAFYFQISSRSPKTQIWSRLQSTLNPLGV